MSGSILPEDGTPIRILVVDDSEADRDAVRAFLRTSGLPHELEEAETPDEAVDRCRRGGLNVMLLDYNLPGDDGVEVLRRLTLDGCDVPVVMLTGLGDERLAVSALTLGAVDYLPKRVLSPEALARAVRRAADLQAARRALRESEERYRLLAENATDIISRHKADGTYTWVSPSCFSLLGWRREELLGARGIDFVHPDDRAHVQAAGVRVRERDGAGTVQYRMRRADGTYLWVESVSRALDGGDAGGAGPDILAITRDASERVAAEAQRERLLEGERQARAAAESAMRAHRELLAAVSHDLRSPLGTIAGAAALLQDLPLDEAGRARQVDIIRRTAERTAAFVADLLSEARMEGGLVLQPEPVEVGYLLRETCDAFQADAERAGVRLACSATDTVPPVLGDRVRILQVLANLVDNAIKFTPSGGEVALQAATSGSAVRLDVRDTGRGIELAHLPHVFDRFWQSEAGDRRGVGLGLALVHEIVRASGGEVSVASQIGVGTTFTIVLPAAA